LPSNTKKYTKEYKVKNREKIREWQRHHRWKCRQELIQLLGGKCVSCGFSDWRALQIDHINGGGNAEKRKFNYWNEQYYRIILRQIKLGSKDYQLLCANCNWIKRYENNENANIEKR